MSIVIGAKVNEEVGARLSKLALEKGVTVSEVLRWGIEKILKEHPDSELETEQIKRMTRKRIRTMAEGKPREMFDGAMFIDRVRQLVNKEKKVLSDWHPLEPDDYDHLIALVEENIKVAQEYESGSWIEKWLRRLVVELQEEKASVR